LSGRFFMIKHRRFIHYKHPFDFKWNVSHNEQLLDFSEGRALYSFLNEIYLGHVPDYKFNSDNVKKASQFVLKNIRKEEIQILAKKLEIKGLIKSKRNELLSKLTQDVFKRFEKPSKDIILRYLLVKNENALAIQIPVWSDKEPVVGHIDLLLFNTDNKQTIIAELVKGDLLIKYLPVLIKYMELLIERIPTIKNLSGVLFNRYTAIFINYSSVGDIINFLNIK